jgi:hypothetical protein
MPDEVGGFAGGTPCRDFAGIVPASRGAHCRPCTPGQLLSVPSKELFIQINTSFSIS